MSTKVTSLAVTIPHLLVIVGMYSLNLWIAAMVGGIPGLIAILTAVYSLVTFLLNPEKGYRVLAFGTLLTVVMALADLAWG